MKKKEIFFKFSLYDWAFYFEVNNYSFPFSLKAPAKNEIFRLLAHIYLI